MMPDAVHYCVHKNSTPVVILSQMNSIQIQTTCSNYYPPIHAQVFEVVLPSAPRILTSHAPFCFTCVLPVSPISSYYWASNRNHENRLCAIFFSLPIGLNILLGILYSTTMSTVHSSGGDQLSNPHKTHRIQSYALNIFMFSYHRLSRTILIEMYIFTSISRDLICS